VCTLRGESSSVITVGGHFDFVERGNGIVDDWSGVSLLPSLYQALKAQQRRHTFVFIAFAREEAGLWGSTQYVESLSQQKMRQIRAFVNLECLGLPTPKVWASRANPELLDRLAEITSAIQVPLSAVNVERAG